MLTFDGHENDTVRTNIMRRVQKTLSRYKDLFAVSPISYTFRKDDAS